MRNILIIIGAILTGMIVLESCNNKVANESNKTIETAEKVALAVETDYLKAGQDLALQTKSALAKYLTTAIGEKGSEGAVEFCNTKAIVITDSMSLLLDAKIKRVSDLPRNPNNQANEAELAYIKKWKDAKANGTIETPVVTEIDGKMVGYYPITTNQMCMQCHGKPDVDIASATLKKIKRLYPADQAIGYAENDLRGIFVVEMNKKQTQ